MYYLKVFAVSIALAMLIISGLAMFKHDPRSVSAILLLAFSAFLTVIFALHVLSGDFKKGDTARLLHRMGGSAIILITGVIGGFIFYGSLPIGAYASTNIFGIIFGLVFILFDILYIALYFSKETKIELKGKMKREEIEKKKGVHVGFVGFVVFMAAISIGYVSLIMWFDNKGVKLIVTFFFGYFLWQIINGAMWNLWKRGTIADRRMKKRDAAKAAPKEGDVEIFDESDIEYLYDPEIGLLGSYPNPEDHREGYVWSGAIDVYKKSKRKSVYLDNFAFSNEVLNKFEDDYVAEIDLEVAKNVKSRLNPLDLTKTVMFIGSMGSGKTEAINSLLDQDFYNRAIVNDIKGDFVEKFYRPEEDIIINFFDERSCYWDIFAEAIHNSEVITTFVGNLVKSSVADKAEGDFWTNQSAEIITESFMKVAFSNLSSEDKWKALLDDLQKYKDNTGDDKTKSSIALTIDLSLKTFKIIAYRVSKGAKAFTLTEFFEKQDGQKIFLLNNPAYSGKLTPFFTGFLGAMTSIILGRADTKEDFTMIILDEYYSLNFDAETKTKILTMIRSKGGQLVLGTQYLDAKKDRQILESSRYATMIFNVSDGDTVKRISDSLGQLEYKEKTRSFSRDFGNTNVTSGANAIGSSFTLGGLPMGSGKKWSHSESIQRKKFIDEKKLQSMPKYHHITIIPSEELVYLGYTELVDLPKKNSNFEPIDTRDYYTNYLYRDMIDGDTLETTPPSPQNKEEEFTEEERFVFWLKSNFSESEEELNAYTKKMNFSSKFVKSIFEEFDEKPEVLKAAKERYSNDERLELMDQFFLLERAEDKYQFCKDKKILGAITGLFMLDTEYIVNKAQKLI